MTSPEQDRTSWTPRGGALWAWLVFVLVALTLFYPMLTGQFLAGDDQVLAGYGFREFAAEYFRTYHAIPQWNPFLFGGLPFFGVIGHGDIFYPTAWLRWFVPTDVGMTLGFFVHLVIAGGAMYALLRGLKLSWTAAVVGGVAYELTGMVASQISPGHDGKLFVMALAPFVFLTLLRGVRSRRLGAFGWLAVLVGLIFLSPQVQTAYYTLVAAGLWTLWLVFLDPERDADRSPVQPLALALGGVVLGVGIAMIQLLPIFSYIQYTPRGQGGQSVGWEYATSYSYHLKELPTLVLPQFNGMLEHYWGANFFKTHTEYLGALVVVLAVIGLGTARRKGLLVGLGAVAALFFLVSVGADTPFYALWWHMPMMHSVRAAGVAFFLVALVVCVWAACGVERLLAGEVSRALFWTPLAVLAGFALLGLGGLLQSVAVGLVGDERMMPMALGNADALRLGSLRLLLVLLVGGGVMAAIRAGKLRGLAAAAALIVVVTGDNWTILTHFAKWVPPASVTYANDEILDAVQRDSLPYRTYDPNGAQVGAGVYQGSVLMAHEVPTLFGYHGMESKYFDALFGGKNDWTNQLSPTLWDLYGVGYVTLNQDIPALPGFHKVLGPVSFPNMVDRTPAGVGYLWQRDSAARWVRVVPGAVKAPEDKIIATVADPNYPVDKVALFPDTAQVPGASTSVTIPDPTTVTARLTHWEPGKMTVALDGSDTRTTYLLVAENWYPDWRATVDGQPADTYRANYAMLSVALPAGAREVDLVFDMASYHTGRLIALVSLLAALGLVGAGWWRSRGANG